VAYEDRSIGVTQDALTIRSYHFPGTVKRIPLSTIRPVRRADMATLRGRGRIWCTANPGYWANFDPSRPRKTVAFLVDMGKAVQPFVTPDDPGAFESALRDHGIEVSDGGSGPFI
jgi:hypothetical protein